MEIEKIIERLKQKDGLWCSVPTGERLISDASTTLCENFKWRGPQKEE